MDTLSPVFAVTAHIAKSIQLYLYSALHNTDCVKAALLCLTGKKNCFSDADILVQPLFFQNLTENY